MPETTVEIYNRHGVTDLIASSKDRVMGWDIVHQYLRWGEKKIDIQGKKYETEPNLKIFSTCKNLIRTIPTLIHDELHPEDLDTDGEDHAADELRYFLQTLRETKTPKPLNMIERRLKELKDSNNFSFNYKK